MVAFSVNPIESVLFLILTFVNAGAILFMFQSEFLGLVFVIVYVGAIAVLFLFVIMMLNVKTHKNIFSQIFLNFNNLLISGFFAYLISLGLFLFLKSSFNAQEFPFQEQTGLILIDNLHNTEVLGQVLYNYYAVGVLIAGLILLVALIGSIVLTLRFNRIHKSQLISRQLARTDNFLSFFK
jgi:NADH-quinone oxidoreductase subunit J